MRIRITRIEDAGGDVLHVEGEAGGRTYRAAGWVSATTNHFPASAYGADGHRKDSARPRAMTARERTAYARRLLVEAHGL